MTSENSIPDIIYGSDKRAIKIISPLGEGKNGKVWKACYIDEKESEAEFVAVKQLKKDTPLAWKKLLQEAWALTTLGRLKGQHPNILKLYDFFIYPPDDPENSLYLVMEYAKLKTLAEYKPTRDEVVDALIQACNGLAYIHQHGIIHKDLKPDNLLFGKDENSLPLLKITDFGQAFVPIEHGGDGFNLHGSILFTAPELLHDGTASNTSDIYSLGAVAY